MRPIICNKNPIVSVPFGEKDCQFWLVTTTDLQSVEEPSRDNAYLLPNGAFYVYNGREFVHINDHSNLKVKWGNVIGDINNQKDLQNLFTEANIKISNNTSKIAENLKKITALESKSTELESKDNELQNQINGIDYVKTISVNGTQVLKDEQRNVDIKVPKNVSELINDTGFITEQVVDGKNFIKNITRNGANIPNNDGTVDIQVPNSISQMNDYSDFMSRFKWKYITYTTVDFNKDTDTQIENIAIRNRDINEIMIKYLIDDEVNETLIDSLVVDAPYKETLTIRKGLMFITENGIKYPLDSKIVLEGTTETGSNNKYCKVKVGNKLSNTDSITSQIPHFNIEFYCR